MGWLVHLTGMVRSDTAEKPIDKLHVVGSVAELAQWIGKSFGALIEETQRLDDGRVMLLGRVRCYQGRMEPADFCEPSHNEPETTCDE
jgi:hypothetical protein